MTKTDLALLARRQTGRYDHATTLYSCLDGARLVGLKREAGAIPARSRHRIRSCFVDMPLEFLLGRRRRQRP